jgi:sulfate adenylyltransferase
VRAVTVDGAELDRVTLAALRLVPPRLPPSLDEDVELLDPEGARIARLSVSGELTELMTPEHGAFAQLMRRPDELPAGLVAMAFVEAPPTVEGIAALGAAPIALAPLVGHGRRGFLGPDALVRACRAVLPDLPAGSVVVPVPVPAGSDQLMSVVAKAYGLPLVDVSFGTTYPPAVLLELERARSRHGGVVLFTGLSGSGKSTVARMLRDRLVEVGRQVTLLDGDVVRRLLSAGLGFSAEDRDLNVRRIGYVAAEVARHGGLAVAAPIAPYAHSRAAVRAMVEDAGATYVLVHVSTPLEVCEARDRKGLYAKARRGEIESFTGVSDPYEVPTDADLSIDTADVAVADAVEAVLTVLRARGRLEVG